MRRSLLLCFLSAVLLVLSFPHPGWWPCAWFGFVPLFLAIEGQAPRRAFLLAYLTGVLFWTGAIYWLVSVTLPGQAILILYLSLYFGLFAYLTARFRLLSRGSLFFTVPALWVLLEYVRSHLLTGFGWALLGYSQYRFLPVIQISDLSGVWGVSFLVMAANAAVFSLLGYRYQVLGSRRRYAAIAVSLAAVFVYGFVRIHALKSSPAPEPGGKTFKVAVVQPDIPQELKWDPDARPFILGEYSRLTAACAKEDPALVIWPEAASPVIIGDYADDQEIAARMFSIGADTGVPLLLGAVRRGQSGYFNSAFLVTPDSGVKTVYDKVHLVPFGEYIPLKKVLPFLESIVPIGDISAGREYTIFEVPPVSGRRSAVPKFAVLICFEDLFPELARRFVRRGARMLVNITNDAWYLETSAADQHFQASVFRAVENRVYLARSANTGVSGIIRPDGSAQLVRGGRGERIFISGYCVGEVGAAAQPSWTVYTRFGDWFVLAAAVMALCGIARSRS